MRDRKTLAAFSWPVPGCARRCVGPAGLRQPPLTIDPKVYLDDIKYLASDELRGRATGSPELEKAAAFIAGKFREFGLEPVDGKRYLPGVSGSHGGAAWAS